MGEAAGIDSETTSWEWGGGGPRLRLIEEKWSSLLTSTVAWGREKVGILGIKW